MDKRYLEAPDGLLKDEQELTLLIKFPKSELIRMDLIDINDYNPNQMPRLEFGLLGECIKEFGFLFGVILRPVGDRYTLIDGEHRYKKVKELGSPVIKGIPLYGLTEEQWVRLTVLMNRIKGAHRVAAMSDMVVNLVKSGVPPAKIAKGMGMEAEEFNRLSSQLGVADFYKNHEYSKSYEI